MWWWGTSRTSTLGAAATPRTETLRDLAFAVVRIERSELDKSTAVQRLSGLSMLLGRFLRLGRLLSYQNSVVRNKVIRI